MADTDHYLRIVLGGAEYLLPGRNFTIEQRDALVPAEPGEAPVLAWRERGMQRDPVYGLGPDFQLDRKARGARAVFIEGQMPIGLVGDEIQLLTRRIRTEPFTPPGPPPGSRHLFDAAWTEGGRPVLVLDTAAFLAFLRSAGAR